MERRNFADILAEGEFCVTDRGRFESLWLLHRGGGVGFGDTGSLELYLSAC